MHSAESLTGLDQSVAADQKLEITADTELARSLGLEISGDLRMQKAWETIHAFAKTPLLMTIRGESGAGKEPAAEAIHQLRHGKDSQNHSEHQFVHVNCAGFNAGTIESDLFGHVKGAFTGASDARKGAFETANEGTIFLDEIGDMPLEQQAKLLLVLEDGCITRVGNGHRIPLKVKMVCATNQSLETLVEQKKFRHDLFQRLRACQVFLPAWSERTLSHRKAVIHFIFEKIRKICDRNFSLDPAAVTLLAEEHFSGNVRELHQLLERICYSVPEGWTGIIPVENVVRAFQHTPEEQGASPDVFSDDWHLQVGQLQKQGDAMILPLRVPFPPKHITLHDLTNKFKRALFEAAFGLTGTTVTAAEMIGTGRRTPELWGDKNQAKLKSRQVPPLNVSQP